MPLSARLSCLINSKCIAFSKLRNEPIFLISTFSPLSIETFASTLNAPSNDVSDTPRLSSKSDKMLTNVLTCFGVVKSGSVTISTKGVPDLL